MMNLQQYKHSMEDEAFKEMLDTVAFGDNIAFHYKENIEKKRRPDLLGKTAKVSGLQFQNIDSIAKCICKILQISCPDIYIYEDFYYGVESKGMDSPWIEISAKTIVDFSDEEITFLIAKALCDIKLKHTYYFTLIDAAEDVMQGIGLPGMKTYSAVQKQTMYRWSRIAHYTSDQFAYLIAKSLKSSIQAIMLLIFNNRFIVDNINLKEYIRQTEEINFLNDQISNSSKLDEMIPYGPFRIKNLLTFAIN